MASSFHFVVANLVLFFVAACSDGNLWGSYCNEASIIPRKSPVSANLDNLLAAMASESQMNNGFRALSSGTGNDTVYGLAQCWTGLDIKRYCYPCIQKAVQEIQKRCPGKSDAQIFYDYCTVRYSQDNFFGTFTATQTALVRNSANYRNPKALFDSLGPLFDQDIKNKAILPTNRGIVTWNLYLANGDAFYAAAQCTTDLRPNACAQCLGTAVKEFDNFCKPKQGCRVYLSSCFVRYEMYKRWKS